MYELVYGKFAFRGGGGAQDREEPVMIGKLFAASTANPDLAFVLTPHGAGGRAAAQPVASQSEVVRAILFEDRP